MIRYQCVYFYVFLAYTLFILAMPVILHKPHDQFCVPPWQWLNASLLTVIVDVRTRVCRSTRSLWDIKSAGLARAGNEKNFMNLEFRQCFYNRLFAARESFGRFKSKEYSCITSLNTHPTFKWAVAV